MHVFRELVPESLPEREIGERIEEIREYLLRHSFTAWILIRLRKNGVPRHISPSFYSR
jgi:hypothetical protein